MHTQDRRFRGAVVPERCLAGVTGHTGDRHNMALLLFHQSGQDQADQRKV